MRVLSFHKQIIIVLLEQIIIVLIEREVVVSRSWHVTIVIRHNKFIVIVVNNNIHANRLMRTIWLWIHSRYVTLIWKWKYVGRFRIPQPGTIDIWSISPYVVSPIIRNTCGVRIDQIMVQHFLHHNRIDTNSLDHPITLYRDLMSFSQRARIWLK